MVYFKALQKPKRPPGMLGDLFLWIDTTASFIYEDS